VLYPLNFVRMKKYLILSVITYIIGALFSLFVKIDFDNYSKTDKNKIELFYSGFKTENKPELLKAIIKNNLTVLMINFIGIFSFGILSCINTAYNGFTLGYILRCVLGIYSIHDILNHILPHSVELIGLILSTTVAYYCGVHLFRSCFFKQNNYKIDYKKIAYLVALSVVITTVAGVFEVYASMD